MPTDDSFASAVLAALDRLFGRSTEPERAPPPDLPPTSPPRPPHRDPPAGPTPSQRIVRSAYAAIRGEVDLPDRPGLCLSLVRRIVEHALFDGAYRFYDWRTVLASGTPGGRDPWARDMEASLRAAGMAVGLPRKGPPGDPTRYVDVHAPGLQPGDLLFRWDTARMSTGHFVGHTAIVLPGRLVIENVDPEYRDPRAGMNRGPTVLTPLGAYPVTTVIRFDPSKPPARG